MIPKLEKKWIDKSSSHRYCRMYIALIILLKTWTYQAYALLNYSHHAWLLLWSNTYEFIINWDRPQIWTQPSTSFLLSPSISLPLSSVCLHIHSFAKHRKLKCHIIFKRDASPSNRLSWLTLNCTWTASFMHGSRSYLRWDDTFLL